MPETAAPKKSKLPLMVGVVYSVIGVLLTPSLLLVPFCADGGSGAGALTLYSCVLRILSLPGFFLAAGLVLIISNGAAPSRGKRTLQYVCLGAPWIPPFVFLQIFNYFS